MGQRHRGGKRGRRFRAGDRSEYLAQYLLSRFSFCMQIDRQEDFGVVDFHCVLGREEKDLIFPENEFYVQIKSNEENIVFNKDATKWISNHMHLPLFIGVIDKADSRMKMYSTSIMWLGLFKMHQPDRLIFQLNGDTAQCNAHVDREIREIKVEVGDPIMNLTVDEIEQNPDKCRKILKLWIDLEKLNIARRSIGRIFCECYIDWTPNQPPKQVIRQYVIGPEFSKAESDIAPLLTALAQNYSRFKQDEKYQRTIQLMKLIEKHLDDYGKRLIAGERKKEGEDS